MDRRSFLTSLAGAALIATPLAASAASSAWADGTPTIALWSTGLTGQYSHTGYFTVQGPWSNLEPGTTIQVQQKAPGATSWATRRITEVPVSGRYIEDTIPVGGPGIYQFRVYAPGAGYSNIQQVSVAPSAPRVSMGPNWLYIPALGINTYLTHSYNSGGYLRVPNDPRQVVISDDSAALDDIWGTTIMAGHINYGGVTGTLSRLTGSVPAGTLIYATDEYGYEYAFKVYAKRTYPKSALPDDLFDDSASHRVALVTCGGPFDTSTGHYRDNIVVWANPFPLSD